MYWSNLGSCENHYLHIWPSEAERKTNLMHPKAFLSTALLPSQWLTFAAYFSSPFSGLWIFCCLLVFVPCRYICADGTEAENYLISVCNSDGCSHNHPGWSTARAQRGSCCDREGTSTATSKSITTGKLGFPKWLGRLFTLGQIIAELISWFYVSCLVTATVNISHWILLERRKVNRQTHSMATPITS